MKNSFSRFVFVALLSAAAEVAFAGSNPMIDAESNQVLVKSRSTVNEREEKGVLQKVGDVITSPVRWGADKYANHLIAKAALDRDPNPLSTPEFDLISADNIKDYPYVDRYLDLEDSEISHFFILRESYQFVDRIGQAVTIPAGFIWDGASIPKVWSNLVGVGLDVGNTRYSAAWSEGLIHDYMYRNPQRFSKEDADELLYINLKRCNNPNELKIFEGVNWKGSDSYDCHRKNQEQGLYDVFTPEFYEKNLRIYREMKNANAVLADAKMPDLTKIINLMKQVIEEYRKILAAGRKMSDDERVAHENLMNEIYNEMYALADEVKKNFTKEEQEQFIQLFKERVQPLSDQGVALQRQIEAKGYGHFVNRFRQMPFGGKKDAAVTTKVKP